MRSLGFLFVWSETRKVKATRMSIATDGLTEANIYLRHRRRCKRVSPHRKKPPVSITKTGGFDIQKRLFFVYSSAVFESEFRIAYAFSASTARIFRYFHCTRSNPCSLINHKERDSPSLQICHC